MLFLINYLFILFFKFMWFMDYGGDCYIYGIFVLDDLSEGITYFQLIYEA